MDEGIVINNLSYKGQYLDDKKHGYGEFIWPDKK
jgi:hypothetical protein